MAILTVEMDDPDALAVRFRCAVAVEQAPAIRREARVERVSALGDLALIRAVLMHEVELPADLGVAAGCRHDPRAVGRQSCTASWVGILRGSRPEPSVLIRNVS